MEQLLCVMQNINQGELNKANMLWWSLGGGRKGILRGNLGLQSKAPNVGPRWMTVGHGEDRPHLSV